MSNIYFVCREGDTFDNLLLMAKSNNLVPMDMNISQMLPRIITTPNIRHDTITEYKVIADKLIRIPKNSIIIMEHPLKLWRGQVYLLYELLNMLFHVLGHEVHTQLMVHVPEKKLLHIINPNVLVHVTERKNMLYWISSWQILKAKYNGLLIGGKKKGRPMIVNDQEIIDLKFKSTLSLREIAKKLGISHSSVNRVLKRHEVNQTKA